MQQHRLKHVKNCSWWWSHWRSIWHFSHRFSYSLKGWSNTDHQTLFKRKNSHKFGRENEKKNLWDIFKNQTSVNLYKKTLHHKKWWASGFSAMILLTVSFIFIAFCFHISGRGASSVPCFIVSYCASITKYMKAEWKALLNIFLCYISMHLTKYYSLQDLNSYF